MLFTYFVSSVVSDMSVGGTGLTCLIQMLLCLEHDLDDFLLFGQFIVADLFYVGGRLIYSVMFCKEYI